MHGLTQEMQENENFSALELEGYIYVLTKNLFFRLNYRDDEATWERLPDPIQPHGSAPPAVIFEGAVYVIGAGLGSHINTSSMYDLSSNEWTRLSNKRISTNLSAVAALKGFVYCIGGYATDENNTTNRVERFNITSRSWDMVASMNETRRAPAAVVFKDNIMVAGGIHSGNIILNSVEKYCPNADQWSTMKSMTSDRWSFSCHVIDENIYAVGGDKRRSTIEKYDFNNEIWENFVIFGEDMSICESVLVSLES